MPYATHSLIDLRGGALVLASVGLMASGAIADSPDGGPDISTPQDAEEYVLGVLSDAGCRMRFGAFQDKLASDGLAEPSGAPDDPATLVAAAPLKLFNEGFITEDPGDPRIIVSSGPGCD